MSNTSSSLHIEIETDSKEGQSSVRSEISYLQTEKHLRVLVQARGNIFKVRGGDTIALEESCKALTNLGVDVVTDPDGQCNPKDFDLLHLYNFATPAAIEPLAWRAFEEDVPFVATTLYEDRPAFFAKMSIYAYVMEEYLNGVLRRLPFEKSMDIIKEKVLTFSDHGNLDNDFIAENASALFSSGSAESQLLLRHYPKAKKVEVVPFGFQTLPYADPGVFRNKHGLNDYVLCVGRIEGRKNQAMLMKALENSPLDIVFVSGIGTHLTSYQIAVQQFKRRGRNLVVSGLSLEELSSAYCGARAHVLPSWYELPGLVSLEAASCGTPVVGTMNGTLYDYLGDDAFYCDPGCIDSIRDAVETAVLVSENAQVRSNLIERSKQYTWDNTARKLLEAYFSICSNGRQKENIGDGKELY